MPLSFENCAGIYSFHSRIILYSGRQSPKNLTRQAIISNLAAYEDLLMSDGCYQIYKGFELLESFGDLRNGQAVTRTIRADIQFLKIANFQNGVFDGYQIKNFFHDDFKKSVQVWKQGTFESDVLVNIPDLTFSSEWQYYSKKAKIIQKVFRGFYSREYEHDFYARKTYLEYVLAKNEEVRKQLEEYEISKKSESELEEEM